MGKKIRFCLLFILGMALAFLAGFDARAQSNSSPASTTNSASSSASAQSNSQSNGANDSAGPYSVKSVFEIGVRGTSVDGNADKYRSDYNFQPGVKLFESSVLMRSDGSSGLFFDNLLIETQGWGGDPDGYVRANIDKTKYYRFDASVRQFTYFNSLRNFALNQHTADLDQKFGDFNLTLMPQNKKARVQLGYSFDDSDGDAFITYDYARDEFPIFAPTRVRSDEYRVGVEGRLWKIDYSFLQGFRYYKEDTTYESGLNPGNNPTNTSQLTSFRRDFPTRGETPFTRLSLRTLLGNRVDLTGRIIYSNAETDFTMVEEITGIDASGNTTVLDRFTAHGNAKRPQTMADVGATVFITDNFRIADTVRLLTFQINGGQELLESLFRRSPAGVTLPPTFVDERTIALTTYRRAENRIEADYQFHRRFSGHIGHRYTDRRVERALLETDLDSPVEPLEIEPFDNRTNAIFWGFRARPANMWSIYFDYERGESNNVFTRVDNYDYTNVRVRSVIRPTNRFVINTSLVTRDNNNPTVTDEEPPREFGTDINTRIYSASADYNASSRWSLGGGYTYMHLTSEAEIVFVFNGAQRGLSRYFMRDHFAYLTTSVQIGSRTNIFATYRFHRDRGQGERETLLPEQFIFSLPYQSQTPEVRMSVRLHNRADWVLGYQFFDYKERFINNQFYQAHLPYTSLRIYLGGRE